MSARRETLSGLAVAVTGGALVRLVAYGYDLRARLDLCIAAGLAVGVCWWLARRIVPPPDPLPPATGADPTPAGLLQLTSLESRLSWGSSDPDRFEERVRPLLVELAGERLRSRRGVDPRTDPDHARTILGDPLWTLMTGPLPRSPSRAELSRLVAAIERI